MVKLDNQFILGAVVGTIGSIVTLFGTHNLWCNYKTEEPIIEQVEEIVIDEPTLETKLNPKEYQPAIGFKHSAVDKETDITFNYSITKNEIRFEICPDFRNGRCQTDYMVGYDIDHDGSINGIKRIQSYGGDNFKKAFSASGLLSDFVELNNIGFDEAQDWRNVIQDEYDKFITEEKIQQLVADYSRGLSKPIELLEYKPKSDMDSFRTD
ncbi:MAG: hypothetical protein ABIF40_01515 [archaeon]